MRGKKGAEYTVTTLVVIILVVIVLVVLAVGFGAGWSNLWSNIVGFFSPVNVDSVKTTCTYACSSQSAYAYCCQIRDVRFEKGKDPEMMTCSSGRGKLGLDACTNIACNIQEQCADIICQGGFAQPGKCLAGSKENSAKQLTSTGTVVPFGQVCCETAATP